MFIFRINLIVQIGFNSNENTASTNKRCTNNAGIENFNIRLTFSFILFGLCPIFGDYLSKHREVGDFFFPVIGSLSLFFLFSCPKCVPIVRKSYRNPYFSCVEHISYVGYWRPTLAVQNHAWLASKRWDRTPDLGTFLKGLERPSSYIFFLP